MARKRNYVEEPLSDNSTINNSMLGTELNGRLFWNWSSVNLIEIKDYSNISESYYNRFWIENEMKLLKLTTEKREKIIEQTMFAKRDELQIYLGYVTHAVGGIILCFLLIIVFFLLYPCLKQNGGRKIINRRYREKHEMIKKIKKIYKLMFNKDGTIVTPEQVYMELVKQKKERLIRKKNKKKLNQRTKPELQKSLKNIISNQQQTKEEHSTNKEGATDDHPSKNRLVNLKGTEPTQSDAKKDEKTQYETFSTREDITMSSSATNKTQSDSFSKDTTTKTSEGTQGEPKFATENTQKHDLVQDLIEKNNIEQGNGKSKEKIETETSGAQDVSQQKDLKQDDKPRKNSRKLDSTQRNDVE
ncbi:unnamed protein product [Bursaphelenchus okinawaensis]|uniref:Uncharacterized protein n=1 Tax=Bursaphelenchus okinawaensis TaxID=465554 RepID=A0A811LV59_9BILA|nr:unnamed protein product [Bursaphelenchus okinawaensis]CAG9128154.1 unnamed protein product [Bursaphelenchus okinawaensis]